MPPHLNSKTRTKQRELLPDRGPVAVDDIREALVIREAGTFLLTDTSGNVPDGNGRGYGLYHADTRHLSTYEFMLRNVQPVLLSSTAEAGFTQEQVFTNPGMLTGDGEQIAPQTIEIRRVRAIFDDVLEETLQVTNFSMTPVTIDIVYHTNADFADIFEVRGYPRERRGSPLPAKVDADAVRYSYRGTDGTTRQTRISWKPAPLELTADHALHRVSLEHLGTTTLTAHIYVDSRRPSADGTMGSHLREVSTDYSSWLSETTVVETDNDLFNEVLNRSLADIRMLQASAGDGLDYTAAGTPWYDALFGRDSCIAALQLLAFRPDIAKSALITLASMQGRAEVPARDEEPGKVLHEYRLGEMALSGELPFAPYYGSVDSTPLFLVLAAEYFRWTNDLELMRRLEDSFRRALDWMTTYGDFNKDGFLSYERRSERGLVNQGWKDSWDSIAHADGRLAAPPISLCEVQGYAYAALTGMATVFAALGDIDQSRRLQSSAAALYRDFNRSFWMPDEGYYALAIDGDGERVDAISSNPGQALWSMIISPRRATAVGARLLEANMFSGWGIRTLSSQSARYNPYGYHLGTVWPHDNALIVAGLKKNGMPERANAAATAIYEAALNFEYFRLPELFGGALRSPHQAPVPYPVACKPQAWAAGSVPMMLAHILGLSPDAAGRCLTIVAPTLPDWLREVRVSNLRIGESTLDLTFERRRKQTVHSINRVRGPARVIATRRWPGTAG
ncbi:MAG: amylo-alpha-1,6-glucosidase [Dehalococcoidia bacterium]|nr:amylo-alpha-1,6-glucosidase [Dehalococcoidia bacterium]